MSEEYIVNIYDFVPHINPKDYGIEEFESIDPITYFITSGDAVIKATFLEKAMWVLAGKVRKAYGKSKDKQHQKFQTDIWKTAGKCRTLLKRLKEIRGKSIFAETEWRDHKLIVIPKNPKGYL